MYTDWHIFEIIKLWKSSDFHPISCAKVLKYVRTVLSEYGTYLIPINIINNSIYRIIYMAFLYSIILVNKIVIDMKRIQIRNKIFMTCKQSINKSTNQ